MKSITLTGQPLTTATILSIAHERPSIKIDDSDAFKESMAMPYNYIQETASQGVPIYGVTSGFGGMADVVITPEYISELQDNLLWYHKTGSGNDIPVPDIRAAMAIQVNSLLQAVSGIRLEVVQRIVQFLNAGLTPHVPELGSIGASGDLVPLTYISGCVMGTDACFLVDHNGQTITCLEALALLGLEPIRLHAKEGLALINGTSVMTGIAVNCIDQARNLWAMSIACHALCLQALQGTNQSFHPFIHNHKPHPGQTWAAAQMIDLLDGSHMSRQELDGRHDYRDNDLIQDRYSLRCLAQYMGPSIEELWTIERQIGIEANSVTDNPLIDVEHHATYHGGNFLGEYVGTGMDRLRFHIGLLAKHLDVQIAFLISPKFNRGLPGSLVGNQKRPVNMGLKGLQIAANSIVPLLQFYGNSITDRYPTYAEQFNQNINSQGFNSANLARQSLKIFRNYVAMSLIFGVQAVDLRAYQMSESYNAYPLLSTATKPLYETIRTILNVPAQKNKPLIFDDNDQTLDSYINALSAELDYNGRLLTAIQPVLEALANPTL